MSAETEKPGTVLQAWVPVDLAAQVKQEAEGGGAPSPPSSVI